MIRDNYGFRWTPKSPTEATFEMAFKQFSPELLRQARQLGVYLTPKPHRQRVVGDFTVYEWDLHSVNFNELWML